MTVVVVVVRFVGQAPASCGPSSTTRVTVVVPGAVQKNCIGSDGPTASSCPGAPTPAEVAPNAPIGLLIVHVYPRPLGFPPVAVAVRTIDSPTYTSLLLLERDVHVPQLLVTPVTKMLPASAPGAVQSIWTVTFCVVSGVILIPVAVPMHVRPEVVVAESVIESPEPAGTPPIWKSIDWLLFVGTEPGFWTLNGTKLPPLSLSANVT